MRTILMLIFILIAGPCLAEDPLETLNTVEDAVTSMEQVLHARAAGDEDGRVAASMSDADVASEGIPAQDHSCLATEAPLLSQKITPRPKILER